jgi:hypothetical protein
MGQNQSNGKIERELRDVRWSRYSLNDFEDFCKNNTIDIVNFRTTNNDNILSYCYNEYKNNGIDKLLKLMDIFLKYGVDINHINNYNNSFLQNICYAPNTEDIYKRDKVLRHLLTNHSNKININLIFNYRKSLFYTYL